VPPPDARSTLEPRRWTLHGLNNGAIFRATCAGVRWLPKAASYAIGDGGTWLASQLMPATCAAIGDNLQAVFPEDPPGVLERRARRTLQAYARDTIDFVRALSLDEQRATALFDPPPGQYRAVVVNYDQVMNTPDDWFGGQVTFRSPTPRVETGVKEAWTLTCTDSSGRLQATRQVIVDRGAVAHVGNACQRPPKQR